MNPLPPYRPGSVRLDSPREGAKGTTGVSDHGTSEGKSIGLEQLCGRSVPFRLRVEVAIPNTTHVRHIYFHWGGISGVNVSKSLCQSHGVSGHGILDGKHPSVNSVITHLGNHPAPPSSGGYSMDNRSSGDVRGVYQPSDLGGAESWNIPFLVILRSPDSEFPIQPTPGLLMLLCPCW